MSTNLQKGVLSNLQLYKTKWMSDLVDQDMLYNTLLTAPHKLPMVLSYVFGALDQENTSVLDMLTSGMGNSESIQSNVYEWDLMIEYDRAVEIVDAKWNGAAITSNLTPGINGSQIQVWVKDKWFGPGAIVEFDNKEFQARVMSAPYQDGNYWVYDLQVVTNNPADYILPSLLESGRQISRAGSSYEEYSNEADIVNYNTPFKLRNYLTIMRESYDITGSAKATVMVLEMRDPKTKKSTKMWADLQMWRALRQWYKTIDYNLVYGKSTVNPQTGEVLMRGTNGRPIYAGAGLLQQIAPSNRRYYTKLTLELLENFLLDLSYNFLGFGERKFLALTGEMGLMEFDRVMREKAGSYNLIDSVFVTGSGQNLTLGGQFTTYKFLNGIELTMKHLPLYDDPNHNRTLHPETGRPIESYRYTFIDFSRRDGDSNVKMMYREGREMLMGYTGGFSKPNGWNTDMNSQMSNARDGHEVHMLCEKGIMIVDPTTSGELILDIDDTEAYVNGI